MSVWDLTTCSPSARPPEPAQTSSSSTLVSARANVALEAFQREHQHLSRQASATAPSLGQFLTMQAPETMFLLPPSAQTMLWGHLSPNEQLQALLATVTRAASLNSNYRTDLATPLDWLKAGHTGPISSPRLNPVGRLPPTTTTTLLDKLSPVTISTTSTAIPSSTGLFEPASPNQRLLLRGTDGCPAHSSMSSCSSSSVSSTSRPTRSNSTESIDLSLEKRLIPANGATTDQLPKAIQNSPTGSTSTSSNSCDVDYAAMFDVNNNNSRPFRDIPDPATRVDRRARKKDQNRRAAYNYRRKKMEERDRMIEEEARLVHKHVRLAGKIARLEGKILMILGTKTRRVFDKDGCTMLYLCPICLKPCDNIQTLRNHLKHQHLKLILLEGVASGTSSKASEDHKVRDALATDGYQIEDSADEDSDRDLCEDNDDDDLEEDVEGGVDKDGSSCSSIDANKTRNHVNLYTNSDAKLVKPVELHVTDDINIKNNHPF